MLDLKDVMNGKTKFTKEEIDDGLYKSGHINQQEYAILKADEDGKFPVYFSYLRYFNKKSSKKIGYLVFCPEKRYLSFNVTTDYNKLAKFDPKLPKNFYLMVIDTLKYDLTSKKLRQNSSKMGVSMFNYLEKHAFYLANEFRFNDLKIKFTENLQDYLIKKKVELG